MGQQSSCSSSSCCLSGVGTSLRAALLARPPAPPVERRATAGRRPVAEPLEARAWLLEPLPPAAARAPSRKRRREHVERAEEADRLRDGAPQESDSESEAHASSPVGPSFSVTVSMLTGDVLVFDRVHATDRVQTLRARVAELLESQRGLVQTLRARVAELLESQRGLVQLLHGEQALGPELFRRRLQDLGIGEGSTLTCLKQRSIQVREGMKIDVCGAGTARVNGRYTCVHLKDVPGSTMTSKTMESGVAGLFCFVRDDGTQECISWYAGDDECKESGVWSNGSWPSAWYMQTRLDYDGIYFLPSTQPDVLPVVDWESYTAETYAVPGKAPMPHLDRAPL